MALSLKCIDNHIETWGSRLERSRYPFRAKWPSRIFRHDPIQNIAMILNRGELLSRNDSEDVRPLDAAEIEIVNTTDRAHQFVRMYFRPRTPTQYHIEGIRKQNEYYHKNAHAPTLGMMIFDARALLSYQGVQLSTCNMQRHEAETGDTDEFFLEQLDFSKIYHFGGISGDYSIIPKRCAEVLVPSPLAIQDVLKHVYCRSSAEKEFLIYLLTQEARNNWEDRIVVSDDMKVFEKEYTFVEQVYLSQNGAVVRFSPRRDGQSVSIKTEMFDVATDSRIFRYGPTEMSPRPASGKASWRFVHNFSAGQYKVVIQIDDCTAYENILEYDELPF